MKGRDSGMPEEAYWSSFFDAACVIQKLFGAAACRGDAVEFGCGYGTFTFPAARRVTGILHAIDIEPGMVEQVRMRTAENSITNICPHVRDFVAVGTGLDSASQTHAMIYNLLHLEDPVALLREAHRVLLPGGVLSVMHWRSDIPTPRGPSLDIRPTPEQCRTWMDAAGFQQIQDVDLEPCCPFHYGITAVR